MSEKTTATVKTPEVKSKHRSEKPQALDRSPPEVSSSHVDPFMFLQDTLGNQAVQRLFESGLIQAKLKINQPHDIYEQEADTVANQVMRTPAVGGSPISYSVSRNIQRMSTPCSNEGKTEDIENRPASPGNLCPKCRAEREIINEEVIQTKSETSSVVSPTTQVLACIKSPTVGSLLTDTVKERVEPVIGNDLGHVRVHSDADSNRAAESIQAKAFTHGNHIWLGTGQSSEDLGLLSHELTHVLQQCSSKSSWPRSVAARMSPIPHHDGTSVIQAKKRTPEGIAFTMSLTAAATAELSDEEIVQQIIRVRVYRAKADITDVEHDQLDRNLAALEWERNRRGLTARLSEGDVDMIVDGFRFTSDLSQLRNQWEQVIATRGSKGARKLLAQLRAQAPFGDKGPNEIPDRDIAVGIDPADIIALQSIPKRAQSVLYSLEEDNRRYLEEFEFSGKWVMGQQLDQNEAIVLSEMKRYGISWGPLAEFMFEGTISTDVGGGVEIPNLPATLEALMLVSIIGGEFSAKPTADLEALKTATSELVPIHKKWSKAWGEQEKFIQSVCGVGSVNLCDPETIEIYGPGAFDMELSRFNEPMEEAERVYSLFKNLMKAEFPILAGLNQSTLEELAKGDLATHGNILAPEVVKTLLNIKKAHAGLRQGKYSIWKLPRIIKATRAHMLVYPGSMQARLIDDKIIEVLEDQSWIDLAILVISVGLAILAAIPSGGSSLVLAAEIGGAFLDIYLLGQSIEEYQLQMAAAGTHFDPAKAIAEEEPSMGWLALELIAAGVGATAAFRAVRKSVALRRSAQGLPGFASDQIDALRLELNGLGEQTLGYRLGDELVSDPGEAGRLWTISLGERSKIDDIITADRSGFTDPSLDDAYSGYRARKQGLGETPASPDVWASRQTSGPHREQLESLLGPDYARGVRPASTNAYTVAMADISRPAGYTAERIAHDLELLNRNHPKLYERLDRLLREGIKNGRVNQGHLNILKGNMAEILSESIQARRLTIIKQAHPDAELMSGIRAQLVRPDGTLGQPVLFTDNIIASRRGQSLQMHEVIEVKSGSRGGQEATSQIHRWIERNLDEGFVLHVEGDTFRYMPGAEGSGRVVALARAERTIIAPLGSAQLGISSAEQVAAPVLRKELEQTAQEINYLARKILEDL